MTFIERKISDVCIVVAGQSPEGKYYNSDGKGLPFYQGKKEFNEKFIGEPKTWTTKVTKEALEGDILMSVRAPVGPVNFSTQKICIGRGLAAIRASKKVDREYLFYFLTKHESEIIGNTGAVFNSINKSQIGDIRLPFPALSEQKKIVDILDKAFIAIDQATANIKKNIQNTKELFQSKLNEIFSEKGKKWEEKLWKNILEIRSGRNQKMVENPNGKYPILGSAGKVMGYADDYICEDGTTIIGRKGTINSPMYIETKFWNVDTAFGLHALEGLDKQFLYYFCVSYDFTVRDKGSGRPSLVKNDLLTMSMPVPNTEIQREIVEACDLLSEQTKLLVKQYLEKVDKLDCLKKSILQKAFAGELSSKTIKV